MVVYNIIMETFTTTSSDQTRNLGTELARELRGGEVLCLSGDLGAGKTTFTQGLLEGLGAQGPYTSPTFAIMKQYEGKKFIIHHIDTYRVQSADLIDLGWKDFVNQPEHVTIVEWAERISDIIPENAVWLQFEWVDEQTRTITMTSQKKSA